MRRDPIFSPSEPGKALAFLQWAKRDLLTADSDALTIMRNRDRVLAEFGPIFRNQARELTAEQIGRFLDFDANRHWTGLHRQKTNICSDMEAVQRAIRILVDRKEFNDDVEQRFNEANRLVRGFGEGIITPILFVAFPEHYGVWNSKSQFALKLLGLWPIADRGESKGRTYYKVNNALLVCRDGLNRTVPEGEHPVDLWTIDYYWHAVKVMSDDNRLFPLLDAFRGRVEA